MNKEKIIISPTSNNCSSCNNELYGKGIVIHCPNCSKLIKRCNNCKIKKVGYHCSHCQEEMISFA